MEYTKTEEGKVALFYYQPVPKLVRFGDKSAYFDCQHGVSLSFVDEADAPILIGMIGGCCGGKRQIIYPASPTQYSHWRDGKGGR